MGTSQAPRDDLVRATWPGVELRAADDGDDSIGTMTGHFSVFDTWYEVASHTEGHFMERIAPGAFTDTIAKDRASMKVTLNHGTDPQAGDKPLGRITELEEDTQGARFEVALLDTSYNRDILPGLRESLYGSSMRFSVQDDSWSKKPERSDANPDGIPERTITRANVSEFGPVTFPANASATAGVRSMTDRFRGPEPATPAPEPPTKETAVETEYITRDEKAARVVELRAQITREAAEYPGVLPTDAQLRWDSATAELAKLETDIAAWDERVATVRRLTSESANEVPVTPPAIIKRKNEDDIFDIDGLEKRAGGAESRGQAYRDHAMRAVEQAVYPESRNDPRDRINWLIDTRDTEDKHMARRVLATGSPVYRRAFNKLIKGQTLSPEEQRAASLAVGVDGTGGYAVPFALDPSIIHTGAHSFNPYRQACRVETIVGTDTWQGVTANAVTVAYVAEAAAATEVGPTFTQPELVAKRAHGYVAVSIEMMQDRADIASELASLFAEAKDTYEEAQFSGGAGTTVFPEGVVLDGAYTPKTTVTNDVTAVADILAVEADLPIRHRANAQWFLSRAGIRAVQAWETTGGQLFGGTQYPSVGSGIAQGGNTGLRLLGYPVWEAPSVPWLPTTDASVNGALIDPRSYLILDRVGMTMEINPHVTDGATPNMPTGQRGVYVYWRGTARVLNVDAGRQLKVQ